MIKVIRSLSSKFSLQKANSSLATNEGDLNYFQFFHTLKNHLKQDKLKLRKTLDLQLLESNTQKGK